LRRALRSIQRSHITKTQRSATGPSSYACCTAIKPRPLPVGDIEIGHRSTATCLLGNIAFRTGQKLLWDTKSERITNSREASALLTRQYRAPWKLAGMEG
jgi:hypothetical protein